MNPQAMEQVEQQALDLVRKALSAESTTGTSIAPYIKQDLEDEAYLQLYSESDPAQMSLLKDIPRQKAEQIAHEFTIVDRYGNHKTKASFAANGLPSDSNIEGTRKVVNLKIYGKTTAVQGLTVLQNTIRAMGQPDIASANDAAVKLLLMFQINAGLYGEDTRATLDTNGFKGVFQLIDEMTRKSTDTGIYTNSDVFIDMGGLPMSMEGNKGLRSTSVGMGKRNGVFRRLYLAPEALEAMEGSIEDKQRWMMQQQGNTQGMILGNSLQGAQVNGNIIYFRRDNALSSVVRCGTANDRLIPGAPLALTFGAGGAGGIDQPAVNAGGTGRFNRAGQRRTGIVYIVTAVNDVGESIGSAVSASVDATAAKTIEFDIRPRGNELSFRIYRGFVEDDTQADTVAAPVVLEPQLIFEIPNGGAPGNTNAITVIDKDQFMPGTTVAWGTDLYSPNAASLDRGQGPVSATNEYTVGRSAVALAQLTGLFEFDLAKLAWLYSNKLYAQVLAPQVPKPWANVVYYNVGGRPIKKSLLDRPS